MLQNGGAETEIQLGVALCNFMQALLSATKSGKTTTMSQDLSLQLGAGFCYSQTLKLNFAWYLCCVSVVFTIVFANSHSAGRAK